jgi:ubiquinone/menaquinone biosynthesis C-methylase UbiE
MSLQRTYNRFLGWAFERLYHEFAWTYDLVAALVSSGYWQQWIVAAQPWLHGDRVLELGCGTGYFQAALAGGAMTYAGCDASPQMLNQARRRLRRAGVPLRLLQSRAQRLPFSSAVFTDVVATFPAPYILDPATLAEVRRVLRRTGQLLIVDGRQIAASAAYAETVALALRITQQAQPPADRYRALLEQAGFSVSNQTIRVGQSTVMLISAHLIDDANR